jgi:ABC-2 type transport system ATP-binding protein
MEWPRALEPMSHLSRGQQQKIAVGRAFLTSPVLMLLDEPTTGLDPRSKYDVQAFIRDVQRDHDATILLTTHDMAEAELLCDRIAFLSGGRIVAFGTPLELREMVANGRPIDSINMETVFMELTGRSVEEDEEEQDGATSVGLARDREKEGSVP